MDAERRNVLDLYVGNFAARQDAYVKDSRAHIREPLDAELADAALREGFSISAYLAWPEGQSFRTHVGAIDFDMDDGLAHGHDVRAFFGSQGFDTLLVASRRGAHLWVCSGWQPVPATVMRRALTNALTLCSVPMEKAEVFPKRSRTEWGVGALRMPLMRHPKTGVTYPAYDPDDDAEIADVRTLVIVMAELVTSSEALGRLAGPEAMPDAYPRYDAVLSSPARSWGTAPLVSELLSGLGVRATPGHSVRCPFHEDDKASLQIAPDDLRAWCKSPGCPIYNDGRGFGSVDLQSYLRKDTHGDASPRQ